jgi:hypothetical protein
VQHTQQAQVAVPETPEQVQIASFIKAVMNLSARQVGAITASVGNFGGLWLGVLDSDNRMVQHLHIGNAWEELAKRGIELQPDESVVFSFTIGASLQLIVRFQLTLHVGGLFKRRKLRVVRLLKVECRANTSVTPSIRLNFVRPG